MSRLTVLVVGVLALALALRAACGEWRLASGAEPLPDVGIYENYARSIVRGDEYFDGQNRARRAPGYPLFIALCWRLAGGESEHAVIWAQAVLGAVGCWIVFRMARRLELSGQAPAASAFIALLLTAMEPYSIALAAMELSETLFTALLLAAAYASLVFATSLTVAPGSWSEGLARGAIIGLLAGMATLVRPSGLLLAPLAAVIAMTRGANRRWMGIIVLGGATGFLLLLFPWWLRNARVFGTFVPTTLNVGESLYDGLSPTATGSSDMSFLDRGETVDLDEPARDRYWRDRAIAFVRADPGRAIELALVKLGRFWSPWPNASQFQSPLVIVGTTVATLGIWVFAVVGAWEARRRPDLLLLSLAPAMYFCALHLVFVSSVRYRAPATPFLCLLGAIGAARLWSAFRARRATAAVAGQ